jgi:hypothetical protein
MSDPLQRNLYLVTWVNEDLQTSADYIYAVDEDAALNAIAFDRGADRTSAYVEDAAELVTVLEARLLATPEQAYELDGYSAEAIAIASGGKVPTE